MDFLIQIPYAPLCLLKILEMYDYILSNNLHENIPLIFEIY